MQIEMSLVVHLSPGYYIQGREHFIDVIAEQLEVHATFRVSNNNKLS